MALLSSKFVEKNWAGGERKVCSLKFWQYWMTMSDIEKPRLSPEFPKENKSRTK